MSWWQWTLISIGLYVTVGVCVTAIGAYEMGIADSKKANADRRSYDHEQLCAIPLWPLLVVFDWFPRMFEYIYNRGKTHIARHSERRAVKAQNKAVKEICKQNGWNSRQLKAAQKKG